MPWMNSTIRAISVFLSLVPFSIPSQSTIFSGSQRKVVLTYFVTEIVHCNSISWDIVLSKEQIPKHNVCLWIASSSVCNIFCLPALFASPKSLSMILDCISAVFRASLQNPFYFRRKESFLFCTRHLDFPMKTLGNF